MAKGKRQKSGKTVSTEDNDGNPSLFQRLFGETGSDAASYSTESVDSATRHSQVSASSSENSEDDTEERTETTETDREQQRFDRELRAKHRGACKNMAVSTSELHENEKIIYIANYWTFSFQNGKYAKAIKTFEGILSELLDRYGESHHRVGAALHNVAVANLRAGLLNDARDAIEEAVRIRKATLGEQHSKVAVSTVDAFSP